MCHLDTNIDFIAFYHKYLENDCIFAKIYIVKKSFILLFVLISFFANAQQDSIPNEIHISGNFGVTNNGMSIIPTFSLQAPAINTSFSISKGGRFSFQPDVRLTFDGRKGGAMFWFRYKLINEKKFKVNVAAHPAYNFALRSITENDKSWTITQARRFWATELAPSYTFNNHFAMGVYYLNGHGLQNDGPLLTHYVNLNTSFSGIPVGGHTVLNINPAAYYLQVDKQDGYYLTGSVVVANKKQPISFMYSYNKELKTNITGSKLYDWNVSLVYSFNQVYRRK